MADIPRLNRIAVRRNIRDNFTRQERIDATGEFYNKNQDKYPDAARDFFKQHPEHKNETCQAQLTRARQRHLDV